jgi:hypothetical protein
LSSPALKLVSNRKPLLGNLLVKALLIEVHSPAGGFEEFGRFGAALLR